MNNSNNIAWFVFAFLAIGVGLYPLLYFFLIDDTVGVLSTKPKWLLENKLWAIGFYGHISFGGLALLIGWPQFNENLRRRKMGLHKVLGKVYVLASVISGICAVGIAVKATGGLVSAMGFILLGIIWLYTSIMAYMAIKRKDLNLHQGMMIYSYAACFAAVTLRIWLPLLTFILGEFLLAYKIVAWLCWMPNMFFAHLWIKRKGLILG